MHHVYYVKNIAFVGVILFFPVSILIFFFFFFLDL